MVKKGIPLHACGTSQESELAMMMTTSAIINRRHFLIPQELLYNHLCMSAAYLSDKSAVCQTCLKMGCCFSNYPGTDKSLYGDLSRLVWQLTSVQQVGGQLGLSELTYSPHEFAGRKMSCCIQLLGVVIGDSEILNTVFSIQLWAHWGHGFVSNLMLSVTYWHKGVGSLSDLFSSHVPLPLPNWV